MECCKTGCTNQTEKTFCEQCEADRKAEMLFSPVDEIVVLQPASECHTRCNDCGQFLKRKHWVAKDHRWKEHALCPECFSGYDSPWDY